MIYNKLNESIIQDEDNIGNDLEAIENEILDDNIVEETFMAVYEMEYNTNILFKSIGLIQLSEAVDGEDKKENNEKKKNIILRAIDAIIAFCKSAIQKVRSLWANIRKAKNSAEAKVDKEFVKKKEEEINEIIKDNPNALKYTPMINPPLFTGYHGYFLMKPKYLKAINPKDDIIDVQEYIFKKYDNEKKARRYKELALKFFFSGNEENELKEYIDEFIKDDTKAYNLVDAYKKLLIRGFRGGKEDINIYDTRKNIWPNLQDYIDSSKEILLSNNSVFESFENKIKELDKYYNDYEGELNKLKESIVKDDDEKLIIDNKIKELNLMKWGLKTHSYLNSAYLQTYMKEFGLAKVQSRKFLNFVTTHLGEDVNADEKESTNESSIFENIKLV